MRYFSFRSVVLVVFIVLFLLILKLIDGYFDEPVKSYVGQQAYVYTNKMLEQSIREDVLNELDPNSLIKINTRGNETIVVNTYQTNKIMADVMSTVDEEINRLNNENYNLELPLFMIFSETLFLDFGPKVNILIQPVGGAKVDMVSRLTEFGINNTLLEVVLKTEVQFQTLIPFQKNDLKVVNEIPILIEVITGEIPKYYYKGGTSLPLSPQEGSDDTTPDSDIDMTDIPEVDT